MADALHLSIPAQGLPNGDATLQHATYPGMQPYPGVGTYSYSRIIHIHTQTFRYQFKSSCFIQLHHNNVSNAVCCTLEWMFK